MSDDWNSDGLNDNWDEAHEFGIDLDGSPTVAGDGADLGDGNDLDLLALFDAADLLGADLLGAGAVDGSLLDADGAAPLLDGVVARPLPYGTAFTTLLSELGDEPLSRNDMLAFVAGVSVANPFRPGTAG